MTTTIMEVLRIGWICDGCGERTRQTHYIRTGTLSEDFRHLTEEELQGRATNVREDGEHE